MIIYIMLNKKESVVSHHITAAKTALTARKIAAQARPYTTARPAFNLRARNADTDRTSQPASATTETHAGAIKE